MDVPFHSSGAMSRAHYAIVRKVESSPSTQSADQDLFLEIKSIQAQLSHHRLSTEKCKECLVILLYCATSVSPGFLAEGAFDFAFPHAINLAATTKKNEEKRIGYLFCSEIMPTGHELRLMLINTLLKDLESEDVRRVCLALDNLITSPNEDVIPAVQSRLHDLLSHEYPPIRRRVLLAIRALSTYNSGLVDRIYNSVRKSLKHADISVVQAAMVLAREFPNDESLPQDINSVLETEASYTSGINQSIIFNALRSLRILRQSPANSTLVFDILLANSSNTRSRPLSRAIVLEIFRTFLQLPPGSVLLTEKSTTTSVVQIVRKYLMSDSPNDIYLFVSCLECIDAELWAGTKPDHRALLEPQEFERIIQLLNFPDRDIRRKTLRIVNKVDPTILDTQISQIRSSSVDQQHLIKILDATFIRYESSGGEYSQQVLALLEDVEKASPAPKVFKGVIEQFLTDVHIPEDRAFITSCASHFIDVLVNPDVFLGPTALVIVAALITEFSASFSMRAPGILSALAARLKTCPAFVQEPCVIAMIRLRADCDAIPSEVIDTISMIAQSARHSSQMRCKQFLEFSDNKELLVKIIRESASPSLPDFLVSLQNYPPGVPRPSTSSTQFSRSDSQIYRPSGALKYAAYDAPEVIPSLRTWRMSSSRQSTSSSLSGTLSDTSRNSTSPHMTAGHLALASGLENLRIENREADIPEAAILQERDEQASRVDLITLESPFQEDSEIINFTGPVEISDDFDAIWQSFGDLCDLRGWCNIPIDNVIRRLQWVEQRYLRVISADLAPFAGELKILILPSGQGVSSRSDAVALRLRESEEESCLWRLRCGDIVEGARIQSILNN